MGQLASAQDVTTGRLDRPTERLEGLTGTRHQIDVLWDFTDSDGSEWRILFEARSYGTRLKQSAVFAFDGVVQDIGALSARNCVGVMVTTTGYQRGAKTVGDSRGVLLLELRAPNDGDFKNRLERVTVTAKVRQPFLDNVQVQLYGGTGHGSLLGFVGLEQPDGTLLPIDRILLAGELAPFDVPPAGRHQVVRRYGRGHYLISDGLRVGELEAIAAEVGETESDTSFQVGGRERIAWLLKDAVGGSRVWFAQDGHHWTTE